MQWYHAADEKSLRFTQPRGCAEAVEADAKAKSRTFTIHIPCSDLFAMPPDNADGQVTASDPQGPVLLKKPVLG